MNQKPVLYIREGELAGKNIEIEQDEFTIGRGSTCDLPLPERPVSRFHAKIIYENGVYMLHDLNSKNGTHLNGQQVTGSAVLRDGDEIQIALAVKIAFIGTDATVPLEFEHPLTQQRLILDEDKRAVIVNGKEINPPLSLAQFRLLKMLRDAEGKVCERDVIINTVWPGSESEGVSEQAIDALVRRLRDRLYEVDDRDYVLTVRGHGFRLDNDAIQ